MKVQVHVRIALLVLALSRSAWSQEEITRELDFSSLWAMDAGDPQQQPPPPFGMPPGASEKQKVIFGIEPLFPYTRFDESLYLEDRLGVGADFVILTTEPQGGIRFGYVGWNTETEPQDSGIPDEGVRVRQYRMGIGANFLIREGFELGAWSVSGVYRFHRDRDSSSRGQTDDTSPYTEEMLSFSYLPHPNVRIGLTGVITHTQSSFNHRHTHLHTNYSILPALEVRF